MFRFPDCGRFSPKVPVKSGVARSIRLARSLVRASVLVIAAIAAFTFTNTGVAFAQTGFPGIGREATEKELRAWDIDVRPDFKGLPAGSGSVTQGQDVWEAKCASCHGVFGESNEIFTPIIGGTTKDDIRSGRVTRLTDEAYPQRTTLMKVPTLSTLWDYINRAMPWNKPKSLTVDEVYAVTAFILNLAEVIPENYVLSDKNIAQVQQMLPNRNGVTMKHAMWPGKSDLTIAKTDIQGSNCMVKCPTEAKVQSFLPDYARDAHGNLAEQNRLVGAQRGANTVNPAAANAKAVAVGAGAAGATAASAGSANSPALLAKHGCVACHAIDSKVLGPSFKDVAKRYAGQADAVEHLSERIKAGGSGIWGVIPMPAQALPESDAKLIAQWLATGANK